MPVYEFKCSICSKTFEVMINVLFKNGDITTLHCPYCKSSSTTKLINNANFRLLSNDWTKNNYENKIGKGK